MIKVAIVGATGRMGRTLIQAVSEDVGCQLSAAVHKKDSPFIGVDAGELVGVAKLDVLVTDQLVEAEFDVLIDFTLVKPSLDHLAFCLQHKKMLILGTTGFDVLQSDRIKQASAEIPIVMAPNMSIGVNLCFHLLKQAAAVVGESADIEIIETHHRNKLDSPSGTALRMGEVIADSLGRNLDDCAVYRRQGISEVRDSKTIGFSTVRAGDVVGDHTVLFASEGERIELTHKSSSRLTYATGALRAAKWLSRQPNGLYDMQDVLGLN